MNGTIDFFKDLFKNYDSARFKYLSTLFGSLVGTIVGGFKMALTAFKNTLNGAYTSVKSFNQMGVNTSRAIGLGYKESIAYTQTLINRTQRLSALYGVTADKIAAIQDSLAKATGRAIMLSNAQAEYATALNKMLGDGVLEEYQKNIIKTMGGSVDAAQKAAVGAYAKATRAGLAAADFSSKVAQNLSLANKVTFRSGIDGITKMTALSERLGFNLQSIESSAQAFNDIQGAVEGAARLQALGGGAAAYGSNPLAMMYEAMYDMESYTERITKMVKGMAVFNSNTGLAEMAAQNKEFLRNYAEILKIPYDDLYSMAANQAKEAFAKNRLGNKFFDSLAEGDEDFKNFILNTAQWNDKKQTFEVTLPGQEGNPIDLKEIRDSDRRMDELKKAWKESTMTEVEAFLNGARQITSIDERISGIMSIIGAMLADKLLPFLDIASRWLLKAAPKIASVIGNALSLMLTPGFWKNIGIQFLGFLTQGLGIFLQAFVMASTKFGAWGIIIHLLGGIIDMLGTIFDVSWMKNVGKILDGRWIGELFNNLTRKLTEGQIDQDILAKQNMVITDAANLIDSAIGTAKVASKYALSMGTRQERDYSAELNELIGEVRNNNNASRGTSRVVAVVNEQERDYSNDLAAINRTNENNNAEEKKFRVTAMRAFNDIKENTRRTYTSVNDFQSNSAAYAQAQINAIDDANESPTAANQNVNPRVYDEMGTSYASMLGINGNTNKVGGSVGMLGSLLGLYGVYKFGKMGLKAGFGLRGGGAVAQAASGGKPKLLATIGRQVGSGIKTVGTDVGNTLRNTNLMFKANRYGTKLGPALTKTFSDARMLSRIDPSFARGARIIKGFGSGFGLGLLGMAGNKITDKLVKPEDYGSNGHYIGRTVSTALEGAGIGATIGSFIPIIGTTVGAVLGGTIGALKGISNASNETAKERERVRAEEEYRQYQKELLMSYRHTGFATAAYNPSMPQVSAFSDAGLGGGNIVAAPVGEREYIYTNQSTQTVQNNSQNTIKVSDITVNVNGTIKLESNGNSTKLDVNSLLKDKTFIDELVKMVFNQQNIQANNGRISKGVMINRYATGMGPNSYNASIA